MAGGRRGRQHPRERPTAGGGTGRGSRAGSLVVCHFAVSFDSISGSSKSVDEASEDGPVKWAVVKALQRLFKPESIPAPTPVSTSIPKVKLDVHLHQGDQAINLPSPPAVENKVDIHLPESPPPVVNVGPTPITIENKVDVPPAEGPNVVEPAPG